MESPSEAQAVQPCRTNTLKMCNFACVAEKIAAIYADRLLSDVCLVINGVEYPAHRLILCASSDVFQIMLMNPQWSESHENRIELTENPECAQVFDAFLRFFYTGQIVLHSHSLIGILMLADKYNVKDLIFICLNYMKDRIALAGSEGTIVTWLQYAMSMACLQLSTQKVCDVIPELWKDITDPEIRKNFNEWDHLLDLCKNYIKWNFETVADTQSFLNFQPDVLIGLLQQNDLVVTNEMVLHKYVTKWLIHQKERIDEEVKDRAEADSQFYNLVQSVTSHIRFPMIPPKDLAQLLLSPLVNKYKEFYIERMAIGVAFHSGEKADELQKLVKDKNGRLLFTPRLYTSEHWSSVIFINNYRRFPYYQPRTLVCTTLSSLQEYISDTACEWVVDLYPKGLWFQQGTLICWHGTTTIPEEVIKTVRLTIMCKNPPQNGGISLKIGVLVYGKLMDVEHVMEIACHTHTFTTADKVKVINNLLPYSAINSICNCFNINECSRRCDQDSPFLVGNNRDLKIQVILIPLAKNHSVIDPPYNSSVKLPNLPI